MKRMKKILAMVMAMAMVLGMSLTTFAANNGADGKAGTSDDMGTITVQGIEQNTGDEPVTVTAYRIITATYDNDGQTFAGYEVVEKYAAALAAVDTGADISLTIEQVNAVVEVGFDGVTGYQMVSTEAAPTSYTAEVPVGTYIVMITGADSKIYSPVIVSVAYTTNNGFEEGTVNVISDGNSWVKVSSEPTVEKTAKSSEDATDDLHSVNIGEDVCYDVVITPVPYYNGADPVLNIVDQLSDGLTLKEDSVTVTTDVPGRTLTEDVDYTVKIEGQQLTVDFVVNGEYTLNDIQGQTVTVSYSATVNGNAVINQNANNNDVTLNFTRDSNTTGNEGTDNSKTYTYTFDIGGAVEGSVTQGMLTKTGEFREVGGEQTNTLPGAEFTLYTDADATSVYSNDVFDGKATSGSDGQLAIKGLAEGTYYLKETKAPDGYSLNEHVYVIKIEATYTQDADGNDGLLESWKITIDDQEGEFTVNNGVVTEVADLDVTIPNTKITSLPSTGGIGTTIFTIGGVAIMVVAAGLFFATRKKASK